jgi:hypothetical protein
METKIETRTRESCVSGNRSASFGSSAGSLSTWQATVVVGVVLLFLRNPEFDPVENVFNFIWLEREAGTSPALVIAGSIALVK